MDQTPDEAVKQFLETIIRNVHGDTLDVELRATMLIDLTERLNQRMILTVLGELTEPEQAEFEQIASTPNRHGEIETYLRARIPRYDELMLQSMQQFRDEYILGSGPSEGATPEAAES